jgi:MYXO-CTERM domain-containing protein
MRAAVLALAFSLVTAFAGTASADVARCRCATAGSGAERALTTGLLAVGGIILLAARRRR